MVKDPYEGRTVFLDVGNGTNNPRVRIKKCTHCGQEFTIPVEEVCPKCGYDAGAAYDAGMLAITDPSGGTKRQS